MTASTWSEATICRPPQREPLLPRMGLRARCPHRRRQPRATLPPACSSKRANFALPANSKRQSASTAGSNRATAGAAKQSPPWSRSAISSSRGFTIPVARSQAFDAYVASGDKLLWREAQYGRIQALRSLGPKHRRAPRNRGISQALPTGVQKDPLRARLQELGGSSGQ